LLHINHELKLHLITRDLSISELGFKDNDPSFAILPTVIPSKLVPSPTLTRPRLVPVPELAGPEDAQGPGGVLVIGGRTILYYEMTDIERRQRYEEDRQNKREEEARKAKARKSPSKSAAAKRGKKTGSHARTSSQMDEDIDREEDRAKNEEEEEAKLREKMGENKRRKANAAVDWPWSLVDACVSLHLPIF
jgi:DNA damage-binding protein 1